MWPTLPTNASPRRSFWRRLISISKSLGGCCNENQVPARDLCFAGCVGRWAAIHHRWTSRYLLAKLRQGYSPFLANDSTLSDDLGDLDILYFALRLGSHCIAARPGGGRPMDSPSPTGLYCGLRICFRCVHDILLSGLETPEALRDRQSELPPLHHLHRLLLRRHGGRVHMAGWPLDSYLQIDRVNKELKARLSARPVSR